MPLAEFEVSGTSLCSSTTVLSTVKVPALMASTSPPYFTPPTVVWGDAVSSPGNRGETNRVARITVPSAVTDRCRTWGPTSSDANVAPLAGLSLRILPASSSAT